MSMLRRILTHPLARDLQLDDVEATLVHRKIFQEKAILRQIYSRWYQYIIDDIPALPGAVLEIGSGPGFFREFCPEAITSDILLIPGTDIVLDAKGLPFCGQSLKAITMVNVLHHIPDASRFFAEAARCLVDGGVIVMVEPWVTPWSKFIYKHFHHEPFLPDAEEWAFVSSGPLTGANGALPWIIFKRDQERFLKEYSSFTVEKISSHTAVSYLFSGGTSMRSFTPEFSASLIEWLDERLTRWVEGMAMFATITLRKGKRSK